MIPEIDSHLGISVYATDFVGIGGTIRDVPEHFQVYEVLSERASKSIAEKSGYAVYKLVKKNIDTSHALDGIFRRTGLRLKSLGLKDASAVTEQFVCSSGKGRFVNEFATDKFSLSLFGFARRPLAKKDMTGNRFKITMTGNRPSPKSFNEEDRILNFYGYQRFGSKRPVTHLVGKAILHLDFDEAVRLILSHVSKYDSQENSELRAKLSDSANYEKCLRLLPFWMDTERLVLSQLIAHGDPFKAIRAIPVSLRRFYVQAYQSYLFNRTLSAAYSAGEELFASGQGDVCFDGAGTIGKHATGLDQHLAVPFVGYSYYKKTRFHPYISEILESEEITPGNFFIKEMQEASSEGGFRQCAVNCTDYTADGSTVQFTLSRGSFATILLREIMKPEDPMAAGF